MMNGFIIGGVAYLFDAQTQQHSPLLSLARLRRFNGSFDRNKEMSFSVLGLLFAIEPRVVEQGNAHGHFSNSRMRARDDHFGAGVCTRERAFGILDGANAALSLCHGARGGGTW
jgi:hypothetical protein